MDKPKQSLETVRLGARLKRGTDITLNVKQTLEKNGGKFLRLSSLSYQLWEDKGRSSMCLLLKILIPNNKQK